MKATISLRSSRPLTKSELLPALEAALDAQGLAIVLVNGSYRIAPIKDAARAVAGLQGPGDHPAAGYSIQVVPLEYIGAADMQRILEPLAPAGGILRVDESRNLLLLAGTGPEITTMLDVVKTFDVDWLAGMSFALFNLSYVDPKSLAAELGEIFADPRSPLNGMVRLIPIQRLNSILVVTPQKKYLGDVETWVKRLDLGGSAPGRRIYVYNVQNSKAADLAKSLNRILAVSTANSDSPSSIAGTTGIAGPSLPGSATGYSMGSDNGSTTLGSFAQRSIGTGLTPSPTNSFAGTANSPPAARDTLLDTDSVRIVPDENNNSLLIMASSDEFGVIEAALKRLDVPARQVLIEASLAEVTLTDQLQYGLQWAFEGKTGSVTQSANANGSITQQFPGLSFLFTGHTNIQAVLNSLQSVTQVRVLSNPKLMVLNNHPAQLQIGDEVPIATQSSVGTLTSNAPIVNSVEYRDTGVILRITPRVNQNGLVQLDIDQEVSDVSPTTSSAINSPTINQRMIATTVSVKSDETIALGGLIQNTSTKSKSGVPFLSKIPGVGALFGNHDNQSTRTELIVLITPHVVRDDDELHATMQELRQQFKAVSLESPVGAKH